jgi:hypothetical protein
LLGLDDSDDEEKEEAESATASDFDSSWAPHGSKPLSNIILIESLCFK